MTKSLHTLASETAHRIGMALGNDMDLGPGIAWLVTA